jgi:hypothetical protein
VPVPVRADRYDDGVPRRHRRELGHDVRGRSDGSCLTAWGSDSHGGSQVPRTRFAVKRSGSRHVERLLDRSANRGRPTPSTETRAVCTHGKHVREASPLRALRPSGSVWLADCESARTGGSTTSDEPSGRFSHSKEKNP